MTFTGILYMQIAFYQISEKWPIIKKNKKHNIMYDSLKSVTLVKNIFNLVYA